MKTLQFAPITPLGLLALLLPASAATVNWSATTPDSWGTGLNWSTGVTPGTSDLARILNAGTAIINDAGDYSVSNLWVGAKSVNATGTVQVTTGILRITGQGSALNRPQVGVGSSSIAGCFGRIIVNGGTLDRPSPNPMYIGGGGGRGYLSVSSGNVFMDTIRLGSDNDSSFGGGFGTLEVSGGLVIFTNQVTIGRDRETGTVLMTGGELISLGLNALAGTAGDDLLTIAGGTGGSTGLVQVAAGASLRAEAGIRIGQAGNAGETADGTLRVNGGKVAVQRIFQGGTVGTSIPRVQFDGALLEAVWPTNANGFMYGQLQVTIKAGGLSVDSAGYDLSVPPGFLADASSPGGGIIKSNAGYLKLTGTNTYTGTTVVWGGGLLIGNASSGAGPFTIQDGCGFGVRVSYPGASLSISTLTLNDGTSGTNDLDFELGLGNPISPVISAGTLVANRKSIVNISGAGLSAGKITLIAFTSGPTATIDKFEKGSLPTGVEGDLLIEGNALKFNVTAAPSLHWNGAADSTDWSTNGTSNWLDFSQTPAVVATYYDGAAVLFDDTAIRDSVDIAHPVLPASVVVSNNSVHYTISGVGFIGGSTGLQKKGTGVFTLGTANTYSGSTIVSSGTLQLGTVDVLPNTSPLELSGTLDMNGQTDTVGLLSGSGTVDNTLADTFPVLTVNVAGALAVFSGTFANSAGSLMVVKAGNNTLKLTGINTHTGGTKINNGTLQLGGDYTLGTGTLIFNGSSTDPRLSSDGATPRTITNAVSITTASEIGNSLNNGPLTFTGPVDFGAGLRNVTVSSDTLVSGFSSTGGMNKRGTATLTLKGSHSWNQESEVHNGTLFLDGAYVTNTAGLRPNCNQAGGTARLIIGSGSWYVLSGTGGVNLRVGATSGNITSTNIADIAGTVLMPNTTAGARIIIGQDGTTGIANLLTGGLAIVREVSVATSPGYTEFNFDGGTLQAMETSTTFMQGLTNAFVCAGGARIDSAGFNIAIEQSLLDAGGGLTKLGAGTLFLNGVNTYTGQTAVQNGALGGTGTIAGPVLVSSGATLAPGNPVGTLTINNTVTLQGTTVINLDRDTGSPANGRLVASTLVRGGSLIVTNSGISALRSGDVFDLFDWVNAPTGSFSVTLPPLLPGLSWTDNLAVDGTISVTGTALPPHLSAPVISAGMINVTGTGGVPYGSYYVLTSPAVNEPLANWTVLSTNVFDAGGNFSFSEAATAQPQQFYFISIP